MSTVDSTTNRRNPRSKPNNYSVSDEAHKKRPDGAQKKFTSTRKSKTARSTSSSSRRALVLPSALLTKCIGLKVMVIMSNLDEMIGTLIQVDDTFLLLDHAVHYQVKEDNGRPTAVVVGGSKEEERSASGGDGKILVGNIVHECDRAMINISKVSHIIPNPPPPTVNKVL